MTQFLWGNDPRVAASQLAVRNRGGQIEVAGELESGHPQVLKVVADEHRIRGDISMKRALLMADGEATRNAIADAYSLRKRRVVQTGPRFLGRPAVEPVADLN